VLFALGSLPLATVALVYFINHRYDGAMLWNLRDMPGVHELCWLLSFVSFFFLYPSTFNILEVGHPLGRTGWPGLAWPGGCPRGVSWKKPLPGCRAEAAPAANCARPAQPCTCALCAGAGWPMGPALAGPPSVAWQGCGPRLIPSS
jgi:hypothetical protein